MNQTEVIIFELLSRIATALENIAAKLPAPPKPEPKPEKRSSPVIDDRFLGRSASS